MMAHWRLFAYCHLDDRELLTPEVLARAAQEHAKKAGWDEILPVSRVITSIFVARGHPFLIDPEGAKTFLTTR